MGTATSDIPPIVLIVGTDDGAQQYDAVLSCHGYWVANAASEPEALECAHDLQPDAVIVGSRRSSRSLPPTSYRFRSEAFYSPHLFRSSVRSLDGLARWLLVQRLRLF
jgi:hypothetical protein